MFTHMDSLRVVLEGLSGFHRRAKAIRDADAGWSQRLTIAVRQCSDAPRRTRPATQ